MLTLVSIPVGWERARPSVLGSLELAMGALGHLSALITLKEQNVLRFYLSPDKYANSQFLLGNTDIVWQRGKPQPCFSTEQGIVKKIKTASILTKQSKRSVSKTFGVIL